MFGVPTLFCEAEGNIMSDVTRESFMNPAQSETPGMSGNSMRENRETSRESGNSRPDGREKATSYKSPPQTGEESDEQVIPTKHPNQEEPSSAEGVEGSCSTKGNTKEVNMCRTQSREHVSQGLGGVRRAARRDNPARGSTPSTQGKSRMR